MECTLLKFPELSEFYMSNIYLKFIMNFHKILYGSVINNIHSMHFAQYSDVDPELTYHVDGCTNTSVIELGDRSNNKDVFSIFPGIEITSPPKGYVNLFNGGFGSHAMKPDLSDSRNRNIIATWANM